MLSKSRGQILRVAAVLHVLFHLDTPLEIPKEISEQALLAAQNFVELCNQYTAFLAGRGEAVESIHKSDEFINIIANEHAFYCRITCKSISRHVRCISCNNTAVFNM